MFVRRNPEIIGPIKKKWFSNGQLLYLQGLGYAFSPKPAGPKTEQHWVRSDTERYRESGGTLNCRSRLFALQQPPNHIKSLKGVLN